MLREELPGELNEQRAFREISSNLGFLFIVENVDFSPLTEETKRCGRGEKVMGVGEVEHVPPEVSAPTAGHRA